MGRKKKDALKLDIREKNGRYYAYESTSEWDPLRGKVTKTIYKGRWDPATETIRPKVPRMTYRSKKDAPASSADTPYDDAPKSGGVTSSSDPGDTKAIGPADPLEHMFNETVSLLRTNGPMSIDELAVAVGYGSATSQMRLMIKTMILCGKAHYLYPESLQTGKQKIVLDE